MTVTLLYTFNELPALVFFCGGHLNGPRRPAAQDDATLMA